MIKQLTEKTRSLNSQFNYLKSRYRSISDQIKAQKKQQKITDEAQIILQTVAEKTQNELSISIENIVTTSLQTIPFEKRYELQVEFQKKRNKTEVEFTLIQDTLRLDNPILSTGGGVTDIISFSLRIASLMLSKKTRVIILDEPFRFLSRDLQEYAAELLEMLSKELDLQFIMITHDTPLKNTVGQIVTLT